MICMKCNSELEKCSCPDLAERMRELSSPGGFIAAKWCAKCDNHYSRCYCAESDWKMRVDGKLGRKRWEKPLREEIFLSVTCLD